MRWIRLLLGVVGIFAILFLASCPKRVVMDARDYDADAKDDGNLSVSLRTVLVNGTSELPVVENQTLHSGDRVYFMVRASQPAYLYVVLFGPDGSASVLSPAPGAPAALSPPRCPLRVPAQGTLYLQNPVGVEDVRVVASVQPLGRADRRLCEQLRLNCELTEVKPQPPQNCPSEGTRAIFSSVKMATASERGVASLRMMFKHDP